MAHTALRLGGGVTSLVETAWHELGVAPRIAATSTSFANMIIMVSEAPLIATVQRRLANTFACMPTIHVLECPVRIEPLKASMSWRPIYDADPAHRLLRDAFIEADHRNRASAAPGCAAGEGQGPRSRPSRQDEAAICRERRRPLPGSSSAAGQERGWRICSRSDEVVGAYHRSRAPIFS